MNTALRCLRERMARAGLRDQLITVFTYYRHQHPGRTTYRLEELRRFYERVDMRPPSLEEVEKTLGTTGFVAGYEPGTFGAEDWLVDRYRHLNEPCLKTNLRIRFLDAYEASLGTLQQRFPLITRILIVGAVLYGIVDFALTLAQLAALTSPR